MYGGGGISSTYSLRYIYLCFVGPCCFITTMLVMVGRVITVNNTTRSF